MNMPDIALRPSMKFFQGQNGPVPPEIVPDKGEYILLVIESGMTEARLELAGGEVAWRASGRLSEGALILLRHDMVFRSRFETKATELFLLFFASPDIRFDAPRQRYVLACPDGSPQPLALVHASSTREIAFQRSIAQRAFSSSFAPTGGGRHLKGTVLLLSLLTNLFTGPARTGDEDNPPELRVEKALEADPRRVPIKELAARLGMSPNTLRRRFRRFMNKNPQAFKTDHSLHLARYYILHTQLTFKVIAKRLGFSSASYFTTFIRQHTGKTPREMRKTRTGDDDE